MSRIDYDNLKDMFEDFVKSFKHRSFSSISTYFSEEMKASLSVYPHLIDSGKNKIKKFVENFPVTDQLHTPIYNYACRLNQEEAQSYGQVVAISLNFRSNSDFLDFLHYIIQLSIHFYKKAGKWSIDELKLDVYPLNGNLLDYFKKQWYLGGPLVTDMDYGCFPVIQGEFDSPWRRILDSEDVLSDVEKIQDCIAKRFFGIDHLVVDHIVESYSDRLDVNSKHFKTTDGIRNLIAPLKYKRQKDRYWAHPWRLESVLIQGDTALAKTYRIAGYIQRNHEYVWTKDNQNIEHACQECTMEFTFENGEWKILHNELTLGLYEIGKYDDYDLFNHVNVLKTNCEELL